MDRFVAKAGTARAPGASLGMGQYASLFAGVIVLALAACDPGGDSPTEPAWAASGVDQEQAAHLGPVTYRYNRRVLTAANVRLAVPPGNEANTNALKLVPARSAGGVPGLCPANAGDCPVEDQPGVSLALLERPYQRYSQALVASDLADRIVPVRVGGVEGIAIDFGELDGLDTEFRLIPLGERALLLRLQLNGQNTAERAALERVIETIDLGD